MLATLDLNADLGEGTGEAGARLDGALLDIVTSANVACGGHAGDDASMRRVCAGAAARGVAVGAQVSYADREGFGRRRLEVPEPVLAGQLLEQMLALAAAAESTGSAVAYLKPHGALYHAAADDPPVARAVVDAVSRFGVALPVLTRPGSELSLAAQSVGLTVYAEAFADRGYGPDGRLVSRDAPGALLVDEAEVRARLHRLVRDGEIVAVDGSIHAARVDSVCVHSDTPGAVALARSAREALESLGVRVAPFAGRL